MGVRTLEWMLHAVQNQRVKEIWLWFGLARIGLYWFSCKITTNNNHIHVAIYWRFCPRVVEHTLISFMNKNPPTEFNLTFHGNTMFMYEMVARILVDGCTTETTNLKWFRVDINSYLDDTNCNVKFKHVKLAHIKSITKRYQIKPKKNNARYITQNSPEN